MRHGLGHKKLNRTSEHRKMLLKNMLNSLIKYEQITTTLPKAKFLKPQADKIITLGKKDTLQNTKLLISKLQDKNSATKVKKTFKIHSLTDNSSVITAIANDTGYENIFINQYPYLLRNNEMIIYNVHKKVNNFMNIKNNIIK